MPKANILMMEKLSVFPKRPGARQGRLLPLLLLNSTVNVFTRKIKSLKIQLSLFADNTIIYVKNSHRICIFKTSQYAYFKSQAARSTEKKKKSLEFLMLKSNKYKNEEFPSHVLQMQE